eukprot:6444822-Amphidinium_carterae.2
MKYGGPSSRIHCKDFKSPGGPTRPSSRPGPRIGSLSDSNKKFPTVASASPGGLIDVLSA